MASFDDKAFQRIQEAVSPNEIQRHAWWVQTRVALDDASAYDSAVDGSFAAFESMYRCLASGGNVIDPSAYVRVAVFREALRRKKSDDRDSGRLLWPGLLARCDTPDDIDSQLAARELICRFMEGLTSGEQDILRYCASGMSVTEISLALNVPRATAGRRVKAVLDRLRSAA